MSLDKSRIPKRGNSSRKFIPEEQRKKMTDPFVDWIKQARTDKGETISGRMVETKDLRRAKRTVRSGGQYGPCHERQPGSTWTGRERQKAGE